ncbi:hypothetical protein COU54_05830 [Candidatus Pacearchaeota archaeon CG10_big_fil_rev_8_21_14_0_10_31_24]|nr:MAG: hypothetical protein COU54_05830 [Candidatus Pacearchaeota archaeon CG10_big_fil_rev_8_21_14_0_10_31_24]
MIEKVVLFDSGPLINLSSNGLLYIIERLKSQFSGKFIIPHSVKHEVVDRPLGVKRFELGALRVQNLIEKKILELPESLNLKEEEIKNKTREFMEKANHAVMIRGKWVNIVSEAEMACLAISSILSKQNIKSIIAIDERTTRILSEKPESLELLMSKKLHQNIKLQSPDLEIFKGFQFIRSPELVYVAYKKGLLNLKGKKVLEAALYATKFKGSAVSFEEIEQLRKLG